MRTSVVHCLLVTIVTLSLAPAGAQAPPPAEALDGVDTVFVPVGGGSGACGLILVRDALGLSARVVGVGAERADAVARSWRTGVRVIGSSADTFAEGVATRVTFDLTFGILARGLDDFVLLSEQELEEGVRVAARLTHNLAEGAGGAALAAALKWKDRIAGTRAVCVMSGGNLDFERLRAVVA